MPCDEIPGVNLILGHGLKHYEEHFCASVSGFTQGEKHGLSVVFARRAKMNETRTQSKNINHLPLKIFLNAYLSKLLAGGQFEVEQISNPKIPSKIKIFIGFSMKNRKIKNP